MTQIEITSQHEHHWQQQSASKSLDDVSQGKIDELKEQETSDNLDTSDQ